MKFKVQVNHISNNINHITVQLNAMEAALDLSNAIPHGEVHLTIKNDRPEAKLFVRGAEFMVEVSPITIIAETSK